MISTSSKKKATNCCIRFGSLVTVRNQLPAQVVSMYSVERNEERSRGYFRDNRTRPVVLPFRALVSSTHFHSTKCFARFFLFERAAVRETKIASNFQRDRHSATYRWHWTNGDSRTVGRVKKKGRLGTWMDNSNYRRARTCVVRMHTRYSIIGVRDLSCACLQETLLSFSGTFRTLDNSRILISFS